MTVFLLGSGPEGIFFSNSSSSLSSPLIPSSFHSNHSPNEGEEREGEERRRELGEEGEE